MARTVTDAAIALGVMAGPDPANPRTAESAAFAVEDYTQFLDADGLAGVCIGWVTDFMGVITRYWLTFCRDDNTTCPTHFSHTQIIAVL